MSDDDFDTPQSDSLRKLMRHVIDEMPGHVIVALLLVAFMFFYGMRTAPSSSPAATSPPLSSPSAS
jgi:hypothetical protein